MLYIKSITIDKFKSFNHASLLFSNGFNCVVGPNGSGKSTICDALLFGLGEGAARRLRVERYDHLIRGISDQQKQLKTAHVKLEFQGDAELSVIRFIRSDGKTAYRLNGKHMKKHEVMSTLLKYGMKADETNTISQGEIISLGDMKPLELRELIDVASGIKEFEVKKNEAIRELEKVDQKISESNVGISTQKGFLEELKADKDSAEKYLTMIARLKVLNFSILILKKRTAESYLDGFNKTLNEAESKQKSVSAKLLEITSKIESFVKERQNLTKQLSESNQEMGSTNARLESVNIQIVKIEAQLSSYANSITELESAIKSLTEEKNSADGSIENNSKSIASSQHKLHPMEERLSKIKLKPEDLKSDPKLLDELKNEEVEIEKKLEVLSTDLSKINSELSSSAASKSAKEQELSSYIKIVSEKKNELSVLNSKLSKATSSISEFSKKIVKIDIEIKSAEKSSLELDEKLIHLREQRAFAQQRTSSGYERVKAKFGKNEGFFGKASELCSYDLEFAYAIEAAAGSRLEYLVVDSITTANTIITYMRDNSLGRATFIPISDIRSNDDTNNEKSLTSIISLVKFNPTFSKVFSYIFNNTYLINNITDSKKFGLGRRRYVTKDGDLVEQSGVVSGGSNSKRLSSASIDNQIKILSEEKSKIKEKIDSLLEEVKTARKSEAFAEMEHKSLTENISSITEEFSKNTNVSNAIRKDIELIQKKIDNSNSSLKKVSSDYDSYQSRLAEKREKLNVAYNEAVELSKRISESGISEEEIAKIELLRKDAEKLKMDVVSFEKENELLKKRIVTIEKEISSKSKSIDGIAKNIRSLESNKDNLLLERKEIEKKIASGSDESKKVYSQLNLLDEKINLTGIEKGKLTMELSSLDRQISEIKIRKSQYETTYADLSAELSTYNEKISSIDGNVQDMEKEATILNSKLREMGNINLKAPEMFAEKSKDVEEAISKLETLKTERQAVMRMIEEIDSKKLQTFMSTLNDVMLNFNKLCGYVFQEKPEMALSNSKDPFKSGLIITVKENKIKKILTSMSGGEKSLILLILIFAIHMCKPSSIYIFDEVDAALDKENSKKLSHLIKQMSSNAQFIVVSHNDSLISSADTAIGVAKSNNESKAIGLEISSILNKNTQ